MSPVWKNITVLYDNTVMQYNITKKVMYDRTILLHYNTTSLLQESCLQRPKKVHSFDQWSCKSCVALVKSDLLKGIYFAQPNFQTENFAQRIGPKMP